MERLLITQIFLIISFCLKAQYSNNTLKQEGYIYDNFISGTVLLKNGNSEQVLLNYNANNQTFAFLQNGQYMTLTNPDDVDTVYLDGKKYLAIKKTFYEVITNVNSMLLALYSCKPHPFTANADHNGTSNQNKNEVSGNISDAYVSRKYKQDFVMEFQKEYLLKIKSTIYKANNEKQVRKIFPEKSDSIHAFIEENKIDFKRQDDIIKLIKFCNYEL